MPIVSKKPGVTAFRFTSSCVADSFFAEDRHRIVPTSAGEQREARDRRRLSDWGLTDEFIETSNHSVTVGRPNIRSVQRVNTERDKTRRCRIPALCHQRIESASKQSRADDERQSQSDLRGHDCLTKPTPPKAVPPALPKRLSTAKAAATARPEQDRSKHPLPSCCRTRRIRGANQCPRVGRAERLLAEESAIRVRAQASHCDSQAIPRRARSPGYRSEAAGPGGLAKRPAPALSRSRVMRRPTRQKQTGDIQAGQTQQHACYSE